MRHHIDLSFLAGYDAERLLKRGERSDDGCLIWTGALGGYGYGNVKIGGRDLRVHRVIYALTIGDPGELEVDHLCNVRACFEISHLRAVTPYENLMAAHSASVARMESLRTHCPLGHPYSGSNLMLVKEGRQRRCRICHREQTRESMRRWRENHLTAPPVLAG